MPRISLVLPVVSTQMTDSHTPMVYKINGVSSGALKYSMCL